MDFESLTLLQLFGSTHCELCQEAFKLTDEVAEMADPDDPGSPNHIVHGQCGLWAGMVVA